MRCSLSLSTITIEEPFRYILYYAICMYHSASIIYRYLDQMVVWWWDGKIIRFCTCYIVIDLYQITVFVSFFLSSISVLQRKESQRPNAYSRLQTVFSRIFPVPNNICLPSLRLVGSFCSRTFRIVLYCTKIHI